MDRNFDSSVQRTNRGPAMTAPRALQTRAIRSTALAATAARASAGGAVAASATIRRAVAAPSISAAPKSSENLSFVFPAIRANSDPATRPRGSHPSARTIGGIDNQVPRTQITRLPATSPTLAAPGGRAWMRRAARSITTVTTALHGAFSARLMPHTIGASDVVPNDHRTTEQGVAWFTGVR